MQTTMFDHSPLFPETLDDVTQLWHQYLFEGEVDSDTFTCSQTSWGYTYSFYGTKIFEFKPRTDKGSKMKLSGSTMFSIGLGGTSVKPDNYYTIDHLDNQQMEALLAFLRLEKKRIFRNLVTDTFACCNSFKECSVQKACIHPTERFYNGCLYRKNLEEGKIFFGSD